MMPVLCQHKINVVILESSDVCKQNPIARLTCAGFAASASRQKDAKAAARQVKQLKRYVWRCYLSETAFSTLEKSMPVGEYLSEGDHVFAKPFAA